MLQNVASPMKAGRALCICIRSSLVSAVDANAGEKSVGKLQEGLCELTANELQLQLQAASYLFALAHNLLLCQRASQH